MPGGTDIDKTRYIYVNGLEAPGSQDLDLEDSYLWLLVARNKDISK